MPTPEELKEASQWLNNHRGEIPPLLPDQIGSRVAYKPQRVVPVVSLDEDIIGMTNDHEFLQPWPGQGDSISQTTDPRPTEAQAIQKATRNNTRHHR